MLKDLGLNALEDLANAINTKDDAWRAEQKRAISEHFPNFKIHEHGWIFTLEGELAPTGSPHIVKVLCHRTMILEGGYLLRQKLGPRVTTPNIPFSFELKHIYPGKHNTREYSLCLFDWRHISDDRQWRESYLIAETILPWASEWLLGYEMLMDQGQ